MTTITLGANGPTIAPLGIGTWAWGDRLYWGYGNDYTATQVHEAFDAALEAGITLFDTAEVYGFGESERLVGEFARESESSGKRQGQRPVCIATKYFPLPWRWNAASVAEALTASLERLQRPTVELYQVHMPFDFLMGQPTLMNALADEVQKGRVITLGVSNYSAVQMREAHRLLAERGISLAVNQVQYSLLQRKIEHNGVMEAARELGIAILAYSPIAQGLLTGKYSIHNYQPPVGARRLDSRFSQTGLQKLEPLVQHLRDIGQRYERTPAQVALNWLIAQGNVVPIPGAKTAEQARQNAGALGWTLEASDVETLDQISRSVTR